jgi:phosphoribosylformimino-5-aminoimidazole carboxamide ribotide isomerase
MSEFIVYPAIDLRYGEVVRLRQGKADQQTIYADDPGAVALDWIEQGAEWLHVVNLNGAFGEDTRQNEVAIEKIVAAGKGKVKVQLGGGFRTPAQIRSALSLGVARVILGTAVIEDPDFGEQALSLFGGNQIAFGLDALGQELMTRGWQSRSGVSPNSLAERLAVAGARTLIFTNITHDGMQTGVDLQNTKRLADETGLEVIASGGVATLDDIATVREAGLAGVIVGRALYEGKFRLQEALNVR